MVMSIHSEAISMMSSKRKGQQGIYSGDGIKTIQQNFNKLLLMCGFEIARVLRSQDFTALDEGQW
jgi:hypothetical protein